MPVFLILLLLCAPVLEAWARPPSRQAAAATAWPIERITVEGNADYSAEQVIAAAGLEVGQRAVAVDFDAARERLLATGVFETVGYQYGPGSGGKGYAVSFEVTEARPRFPVTFEDLGVPDGELLELLRRTDPLFKASMPATEPLLERYARAIETHLAEKGRTEKVAGRVAGGGPEPLTILFRPAAMPPAVSRVRFTNNEAVPSTALEAAINSVAVGMPYRESRFRQLLETSVKPVYEARGRVRASFPEVRTEPDPDVQGVVVTVNVAEGESYSLGEVTVEGSEFPSEELVKAAGLNPGDVFNIQQVREGVSRVEKRLRREGHMLAHGDLERRIDDRLKTVDVAIRVEPGPQYLFGRLEIQGLDILTEPAVRKLWGPKPGQPFNADYPEFFLQRIEEDGLFDNLGGAKALLETDDNTRTVDVTLVFRGGTTDPPKRRD